jgi:large subunit ribosomal protein L18
VKNSKKDARLKRVKKLRISAKKMEKVRLCVSRSSNHIYAQIISSCGSKTLASASSLKLKNGSNIKAAIEVGTLIGESDKKAKIEKVVFDRSGFKFHGRVKALAEAARKTGLDF